MGGLEGVGIVGALFGGFGVPDDLALGAVVLHGDELAPGRLPLG